LSDTLVAEETYEVSVSGVTNINGVAGGGGTEEFLRAAPPVDSLAIADSIALADSIAVADSILAADSVTAAAPDTIPQDTIPRDTIPRDTVPAGGLHGLTRTTLTWNRPEKSVPLGNVRAVGTPFSARRSVWSRWGTPPWR
jgi:hypothetical protein